MSTMFLRRHVKFAAQKNLGLQNIMLMKGMDESECAWRNDPNGKCAKHMNDPVHYAMRNV
jgi:hypothetical protein